MTGRKIESEAEALECIEALRESGEELTPWARRAGLDARSLNAWRINLQRRGEVGRPGLVELVPVGGRDGTCEVRCGRFIVEVGAGFDERMLLRVLRVVAAC